MVDRHMSLGQTVPESAAAGASSEELRRLWDAGQRVRAMRDALDIWPQLLARGEQLDWLERAMRSCGLRAEAFAVRVQVTRRRRTERDWERLIRSVLQSGDPWWARELMREAGTTSRELQALGIEIALELGDDACAAVAAWEREHRDEAALEAAAGWWSRSGRVEELERLLAAAEGLLVWRARVALWRREPALAREWLARLPDSPEVRCLEAVAAIQEGQLGHAEAQLRSLLGSAAQAEASSWLSTVLRKQGRFAEAIQAADAASMASPTFNLATRLERELSTRCLASGGPPAASVSRLTRLLRAIARRLGRWRTIRDLEHAAVLYPLGLKPGDSIFELDGVLERFAGNRTAQLTTVQGGQLKPYPLPVDPRFLGASIQRVLWTRGGEAARGLYRELEPSVNSDPLFLIYQGELELWLGDYGEAARIFRRALDRDRTTKWAWIGLGAASMLQGELREAQRIWAKGLRQTRFAGPTLYVYRGECYRLQGDIARARKDLDVALHQKANRLSARINLALLEGEPEAMRCVEQDCCRLAPLLMEALSGSTFEKLQKVLEAMRGNRSSSEWHVSYHLWDRVWGRAA